jgi:hypothetical protein
MYEYFQPLIDAARDAAIKEMPTVMSALALGIVTLIGSAVAIAKHKIANAKLSGAAAAAVQIIEAKAAPQIYLPENIEARAAIKKQMADEMATALLSGAPKQILAKVGKAVQEAWAHDEYRKSAPTSPETPSAKANSGS